MAIDKDLLKVQRDKLLDQACTADVNAGKPDDAQNEGKEQADKDKPAASCVQNTEQRKAKPNKDDKGKDKDKDGKKNKKPDKPDKPAETEETPMCSSFAAAMSSQPPCLDFDF